MVCSDGEIKAFILYTKQVLLNDEIYYIEFIGSNVKGIGSKLLLNFMKRMEEKNKSCYLHVEKDMYETERLVKWYKRFNFVEYSTFCNNNENTESTNTENTESIYPFLSLNNSIMLIKK